MTQGADQFLTRKEMLANFSAGLEEAALSLVLFWLA